MEPPSSLTLVRQHDRVMYIVAPIVTYNEAPPYAHTHIPAPYFICIFTVEEAAKRYAFGITGSSRLQ